MTGLNCFRFAVLAALFWTGMVPASLAAQRERLVAHVQDGKIQVQLQDLRKEPVYQLGIFSIATGQLLQTAPVTRTDEGGTVNLVLPLPDEGLYQLKLKDGNDWLAWGDLPAVRLPKEGFRLLAGEIDRREKKIDFSLSTNCIFRIAATNTSQMNILTLQGWKFGAAGQKVRIPWDFWDKEKVKNYWSDPTLAVVADYLPLPEGFIVSGNPDYAVHSQLPLFRELKLPVDEFLFEVFLKKGGAGEQETREKLPLMKASDYVRVIIAPESVEKLRGKRYEILYFIEGDFVHEETEGASPSNYRLPDLRRPSGQQHLTVNVRDFNGNSGSSTVAFWYEAPAPEQILNQ